MNTVQTNIKLVNYTEKICDLPQNIENKLIVIASDFHFAKNQIIPEQAVQIINQQNPDIVFLLGDFITNDPSGIEVLAEILKNIKSKDGVYAIFGNHDIKWGDLAKQRVGKALQEIAKIKILENEVIFPWGERFAVVGLGDWWSPKKKDFQPETAFKNVPNNIPRIVLTHNPDSIFGFQEYRADLILSGHTHGLDRKGFVYKFAQKCSQFLPNGILKKIPLGWTSIFKKTEELTEGIYDLNVDNNGKYKEGRKLIITSGIGTHEDKPREKIPPEIMAIKLFKKY